MPRGVFNWTAADVARFIKDYHFTLLHTKGSHVFYVGNYGKAFRQVCIPFHGSHALKPRTFKGIVKQSGIPLEQWLKDN